MPETFAASGAGLLTIFPPLLGESVFPAASRRNTEHGRTHRSLVRKFARDHLVIANVSPSEAEASCLIESGVAGPPAGAGGDGHIPPSSIENP
jgi:hypothetical protein